MEILSEEFNNEIEAFLIKAEESIGLDKNQDQQAPACLSYSLDKIKKLSITELGECSYDIAQYSMHITRKINRIKAWIRWCKSKLDEAASIELPNIDQRFGFNERVLIAKNNPKVCKKINKFTRELQMELDMIESIPHAIRFISDAIKDVKFSRISEDKYGS